MKSIKITKETNEIQRVLALRASRNKRYKFNEFIIKGCIALEQARKHNWHIKSIFYNADIKLSKWAKQYVNELKDSNKYAIATELMQKICDQSTLPEMIAIGETKTRPITELKNINHGTIILLDHSKSAGNLGMIIRFAAVFGTNAIIISGHAADEYDPKCIRASVGTFFSLPIYRIAGVKDFIKYVTSIQNQKSYKIIATGDKGSKELGLIELNADIIFLLLGNETIGLSNGYIEHAEEFIKIPSEGEFTSLNIAAASIFLYEIAKINKFKKE